LLEARQVGAQMKQNMQNMQNMQGKQLLEARQVGAQSPGGGGRRRLRRAGAGLPLVALLLAGGCQSAASVEIEPPHPLIASKSDHLQLKVTVRDSSGGLLSSAEVQFKSMTPTMATVDQTGLVTPVTSGLATVLVTSGKVSKEIEIVVQIPTKVVIEPTQTTEMSSTCSASGCLMMLGVNKGFKATVVNDRESPMIAGEVRWSSSDPAIFTVDNMGNVKTLTEGKATLTAFAAGIQGTRVITVKHEELSEDGTLSQ
jgi:hypothetical protein